jgi:hypothetical protein
MPPDMTCPVCKHHFAGPEGAAAGFACPRCGATATRTEVRVAQHDIQARPSVLTALALTPYAGFPGERLATEGGKSLAVLTPSASVSYAAAGATCHLPGDKGARPVAPPGRTGAPPGPRTAAFGSKAPFREQGRQSKPWPVRFR